MDFPEPETPVTATSIPNGIRTSTSLQIVAMRTEDFQELSLRPASSGRHGDPQIAAKIASGERLRIGKQRVASARKNKASAVLAGARPKIQNVIGAEDRVGIVFDDQQRITQIAQSLQNCNQAVGVARMQSDGRLVQNVKRAQPGANPARSRAGCAALRRRKAVDVSRSRVR